MTEWNDDDLHRAFAEWREDDAKQTPTFDGTLGDARARVTSRALRRVAWPFAWRAAAAMMLVAGAGWFVRRSHAPNAATAVALSEWRSPTAFLLDASSDPLLTDTPTFLSNPREFGTLGIRVPNWSRR